ncbi:MAG: M15 family metallopeptidase [Oscillospiraceae bacterium]|jgi:D-alanyl-D-alanine carboxypeptidase|nr:M15 family metallopeptidase [Oscillospiraceae bacterium]
MKLTKAVLAVICACALILFTACFDDENSDITENTTVPTTITNTTSESVPPTSIEENLPVGGNSTESVTKPTSTTRPSTATRPLVTTTLPATKPNVVYPSYAQKYAYAGYTPQQTDMEPWYLTLLNGKYCLPEGYEIDIAEVGNGTYLDRRVVPAYNEMYKAAKAAGHTLTPQSGWRRLSRQTSNLDGSITNWQKQGYSKIEATHKALELIMLPGCSEHNAGLAMDIITWDPAACFENTPAFAWLMEHGADYGFILRYPNDKTAITGVSFEPWHWRYVGKDAAKKIMTSGVCLEEYLGAV